MDILAGGATVEELETLLEDALLAADAEQLADLFLFDGLIALREERRVAYGLARDPRIQRQVFRTPARFAAAPEVVLRSGRTALVLGNDSVNVARLDRHRRWRYAVCLLGTTTGGTMGTMIVRMDCDPDHRDEVVRHLREDVVAWAHEQPGFVSGAWRVSPDGTVGLGCVEFTSVEAAETAARGPRGYHDPEVPFRIAAVDVLETVATARRES